MQVTGIDTCAIFRERFHRYVTCFVEVIQGRFNANSDTAYQFSVQVSQFLKPFVEKGLLSVDRTTIDLGPLPVDVLPFVPYVCKVRVFDQYNVVVNNTRVGRVDFNGAPHQDQLSQGNIRIGYEAKFNLLKELETPDVLYVPSVGQFEEKEDTPDAENIEG